MKNVERTHYVNKAIDMIKTENPATDNYGHGTMKCPKCNRKLNFRRSPVRKDITWGRCSTPNCINWME